MSHSQVIASEVLELNRIERSALIDLGLVVGGSLVIALSAQVAFPLPFTPVPVTGQTLGVLLIGATLGAKRGLLATAAYLLEGAVGLPFFAGGASGLAALFGPTGGYLFGFLAAAYACGLIAERKGERTVRAAIPAFLAAQAILFAFGMLWLGYLTGYEGIWMKGFIPFVPGLILKSSAAGLLLPAAWSRVEKLKNPR